MTAATTLPKRIQRKRSVGWRMPENAKYVGRPTRWGNPFTAVATATKSEVWEGDRFIGQSTDPTWGRRRAVELFILHTGPMGNYEYDADTLAELRRDLAGRDLACWCPDGQPCHADHLLHLANGRDA
ncbi:DUF4326 domain-containing protein [Micromonospora carbonacea]|uniref:DUF4326 domain-containing protein n=1 Tax=Micromonospora carbonacea TaxID=47853 RepID=UPI0037106153